VKPPVLFYSLFAVLLLFACAKPSESDLVLPEIEALIETQPDSALVLLEAMQPYHSKGQRNQAYYYLILTEAKYKNRASLLPCDSLIDFALNSLSKKTDKELLAKAWLCKGRIWRELKEPENTIQSYYKALHLLDNEKRYTETVSKIYYNLGDMYMDQDLYKDALKMYMKSYSLDVKESNKRNISLSLRHIGNTFFYLQKPDSAFLYIQEALIFAKQSNDSVSLMDRVYSDLGIYYLETGEYEESLHQLRKILNVTDNISLNKGLVFMFLQQVDSARINFLSSIESANLYTRATAYYYLNELERTAGNYQKAYTYLSEYVEQRDSIANLTRTSEIQTLVHKYNIETETDKVKAEYKQKIGITLFLFVILLLIILWRSSIRKRREKLQQKTAENELLKRELDFLDLQVQIKEANESLSKLQHGKMSDEELIRQKEMELALLNRNQGDNLFLATPGYVNIKNLIIRKKHDRECFNNSEIISLQNDVMTSFATLIKEIQSVCSTLNKEDYVLCCLSKLKIPNTIICFCMGNHDTAPIRQRKKRIKIKMKEADCMDLFFLLFGTEKEEKVKREP
jgi:tetratricopeptide (TPR) repeat protein